MAPTNIELYEALKRDLNEEAARRIAEVVPAAADLSTKGDLESATGALNADLESAKSALTADIQSVKSALTADIQSVKSELKADIESVKGELKADIHEVSLSVARLEAKMEALHASTLRWMIGLFLPAWGVTAGTLLAVVLKG